jgi:phage I-like protein
MSIHYELVADGVSPHEERYTQELDKRLKKAYPDGNTGGSQSAPRRSDAVESGSREDSATSSPRKVRLTNSQVAIAKRLGVSLQEYAKQVALRNARNGDGA